MAGKPSGAGEFVGAHEITDDKSVQRSVVPLANLSRSPWELRRSDISVAFSRSVSYPELQRSEIFKNLAKIIDEL